MFVDIAILSDLYDTYGLNVVLGFLGESLTSLSLLKIPSFSHYYLESSGK